MNEPTNTQKAAATGYSDNILAVSGVLQALAQAGTDPSNVLGHHFVMVPPNHRREDITELVEKAQAVPARPRGTVVLKDLASLVRLCLDKAAAMQAYIYADPDSRQIVAVFNDNHGTNGWRDHRAEFKPEFTPEFKRWLEKDRTRMNQQEFGEFIEDNAADITEAGKLLEVANTLQAKTAIDFKSGQRLDNGQVQLQYVEEISATAGANGKLEIPRDFEIGLRLFKMGAGYKLKARLKYRLASGKVTFHYELDRPELSIDDAFADYVETLRDTSGYTVLIGKP